MLNAGVKSLVVGRDGHAAWIQKSQTEHAPDVTTNRLYVFDGTKATLLADDPGIAPMSLAANASGSAIFWMLAGQASTAPL